MTRQRSDGRNHEITQPSHRSEPGDHAWMSCREPVAPIRWPESFDTKMIRPSLSLVVAALALLAGGCRTPMKVYLAGCPNWERAAHHISADKNSEPAGLAWQAFPDLHNPVHAEIWKALRDKNRIGDGAGSVCNYYGFFLVTVSDYRNGWTSSFYDPTHRRVLLEDTEHLAFRLYGGERKAAIGSIRRLVEHLLAVDGYKALIVDDCNQIPHTGFQKENPNLPFAGLLAAKGITIRPPSILSKNDIADYGGDSECSVFAYRHLGGEILRYEVRCLKGKIIEVKRFTLATDIGDCGYIM